MGGLSGNMMYFTLGVLCFGYNIGIVNKAPISYCNDSSMSGFVPDLIKLMVEENYHYSLEVNFTCFESYEDAVEGLLSNTTDLTFLPMTIANYQNFFFTVPFINNGLILIAKNFKAPAYWVVYQPFEDKLWGILIILPFILAHFYWLFEKSEEGSIDMSYVSGICQSLWQISLCTFFLKREKTRTWSAKLLIFTYSLIIFILVAAYISTLSSIILKFSRKAPYNYFKSMTNHLVGTYSEYSETLKYLGMNTKIYLQNENEPYLNIMTDLLNGVIDAGAIPFSEAMLLDSEYCDLNIFGSIFIDSYLGFAALPNKPTPSFLKIIQTTLEGLLEQQAVKTILNKYMLISNPAPCLNGLELPLPIDLLLSGLIYVGGVLLFAVPIFLVFRERLYKEKITDGKEETIQTVSMNEKELGDYMNMMIKFECIMGSSKMHFGRKFEELKEALSDHELISNRYEDLLKKLLFKIEGM